MNTRIFILFVAIVALILSAACALVPQTPTPTLQTPTPTQEPTLSPEQHAKLDCKLTLHGHDLVVPFSQGWDMYSNVPSHRYTYMGDDGVLWNTTVSCHYIPGPYVSGYTISYDMPGVLPSDTPSKSFDCLGTSFVITPGAVVLGEPICQQPGYMKPQFVANLTNGTQLALTYMLTVDQEKTNNDKFGWIFYTLTYSVKSGNPETDESIPMHCGYYTTMGMPRVEFVNIEDSFEGTITVFRQAQSICAGKEFTVEMTTQQTLNPTN
jgi:hypothetical protein